MFKKIKNKLKVLGIIYAINDVTSWLLKKDIDHTREQRDRLRKALITVMLLLIISVVINIILFLKYA